MDFGKTLSRDSHTLFNKSNGYRVFGRKMTTNAAKTHIEHNPHIEKEKHPQLQR